MAGLMDAINQQIQAPSAGQTPGATSQPGQQLGVQGDQTQQVRGLLAAKLGKATPSGAAGTPGQSNVGEQMATQQARLGLQQTQQAGKIASQQLGQSEADIAQRTQQDTAQTNLAFKQQTSNFTNHAQDILQQLSQSKQQLGAKESGLQLEQAGFLIRGQNQNYVQELQRQGQQQRLGDEQNFKQALQQSVFSDQSDLLKDTLAFNTMMNSSDRQFNEALGKMSDDFAIKMADREMQQAAATARFGAISGMVGAGAQAGMAAYNKPSSPATPGSNADITNTETATDTGANNIAGEFA